MRMRNMVVIITGLLLLLACQSQNQARGGPVEGTVSSADEVDIHFTAEGGGEPALVFVHCWCCDETYWDNQVDHFSKTNRVVTVELAGHGQSGTNREQWSIQAFAEDVRAVVDKLGLNDIVLIGHSMGGPVSVEAARLLKDRVRGVVGVDNFQQVDMPYTEEQIQGFLKQFKVDFAGTTEPWVRSMFPEGADSALVDRIAGDMAAGPPDVGVKSIIANMKWSRNEIREALKALTVPLHCINTDTRPTDVDALKELVPGYKLRLMPGLGHFIQMEDPTTFNSLLEETLADLAIADR